MKKYLLLFLSFFSILSLSSCLNVFKEEEEIPIDNTSDVTWSKQVFEFKNYSTEFDYNTGTIDTYFKDGNDYVPYIDVKQFIESLNGIYDLTKIKFSNDKLNKIYKLTINDSVNEFNYSRQTIKITGLSCLKEFNETDYSYCLESEYYAPSTFDFSKKYNISNYGFKMYYVDDSLLMEFGLFNLLMSDTNLYTVLFNGDGYFGDLYFYSDELVNDAYTNELKNKSLPQALIKEDYKYLKFYLEKFYGLYDYKNLSKNDTFKYLLNGVQTANAKNYQYYVKNLLDYSLDDLHTGIINYPFYYTESTQGATPLNLVTFAQARNKLRAKKEELGLESKYYIKNGDVAFIGFDKFETEANIDLASYNINNDYSDTFLYLHSKLSKAAAEGVKDIVFDISTNSGGNIGALLRVLGLLSDDDVISYSEDSMTKEYYESVHRVDSNMDGSFEDKDAFSNFNYYILTSEQTFSAANSFAVTAKLLGFAKIIGKKSLGGMCSVSTMTLPSGLFFQSSSNSREFGYLNKTKYYYELGAPVDINLEYDDFYDFDFMKSELN